MNKEPNSPLVSLSHDFATLQRLPRKTIICAGVSL
jgi:hypothetical protein